MTRREVHRHAGFPDTAAVTLALTVGFLSVHAELRVTACPRVPGRSLGRVGVRRGRETDVTWTRYPPRKLPDKAKSLLLLLHGFLLPAQKISPKQLSIPSNQTRSECVCAPCLTVNQPPRRADRQNVGHYVSEKSAVVLPAGCRCNADKRKWVMLLLSSPRSTAGPLAPRLRSPLSRQCPQRAGVRTLLLQTKCN